MFFGALVLVVAVSMILLFLFFVVSLWVENNWNSVSSYECGFDAKSVVRMSFSYRFFLIAVLFLIFDVEISLLLPIPFLFSSVVGYCVFSMFVGLLLVGLVYEVSLGSMEWL